MPAPADSPMCKDLYDKLDMLAEADSNNSEHGETRFHFNIILRNGREIHNVQFVDGSNSLDDMSIDVCPVDGEFKSEWTIVIAEIAAIETVFAQK